MRILFFGRVADALGRELDVRAPEGCTVAELRRLIGAEVQVKGVRASIDRQVVRDEGAVVPAGAEVAFFSVFSGG
jgi:molybdopterin converting factor small subunit